MGCILLLQDDLVALVKDTEFVVVTFTAGARARRYAAPLETRATYTERGLQCLWQINRLLGQVASLTPSLNRPASPVPRGHKAEQKKAKQHEQLQGPENLIRLWLIKVHVPCFLMLAFVYLFFESDVHLLPCRAESTGFSCALTEREPKKSTRARTLDTLIPPSSFTTTFCIL
jgi:hypothetical protein